MQKPRLEAAIEWTIGELETRRFQLALAVLGVVYLTLTMHSWLPPLLPFATLDGGYRAVLNAAFLQGELFGPEVVTTSGPLGFLRNPVHYPGTDVYRVLWGIVWSGALAVGMAKLLLHRSRWLSVAHYGLAMVGIFLVFHDAWRILPLAAFLMLYCKLVDSSPRTALWEYYFAAVLAVQSWVLFTDLLSAVVTVVGVAAVDFARHRRISPTPFAFAGFLAALWFLAGQTAGNLWMYLRTSLEVASGYADVMMRFCGPRDAATAAAIFVGILTFTGYWIVRSEGRWVAAAFLLPFAGVFFLAFKTSFTRCHPARSCVMGMFLIMLALSARSYWSKRDGRSTAAAAVSWTLILAAVLAGLMFSRLPTEGTAPPLERMLRRAELRWDGLMERIFARDQLGKRHSLAVEQLWRGNPIPRPEGPVDIFGDLQGLAITHGLDYRHRPVFQRFTAYTPYLARLNGDFYASEMAPDHVLYDPGVFGNYPPTFFDAYAFRELVAGYRPSATGGGFILLDKVRRRPFEAEVIDEAEVDLFEWYRLPDGSGPFWIEIDVPDTLSGALVRLAYKLPPIWMDFEFADGSVHRYRFGAVAARGGFWVSPMIRRPSDLRTLLDGGAEAMDENRRVRRLRILEAGDQPSGNRGDVSIRLSYLEN